MALDQRKRQKSIEKRKAKQKARKKALIGQQRDELTHQLQRASSAPILHCCVQEALWSSGIGQLLLSRQLPSGDVAFAVFLVDAYCLGIKDVALSVQTWISYQEKISSGLIKQAAMVDLTPAGARKLVEGAVTYARDLGISPHPDYQKAQLIFGDIDASACPDEFAYGKDGKPCFIAGPHDSNSRCAQIMALLGQRLGPDGFNYLLPADRAPGLPGERWYDDFDDEDLDYDDDEFDSDSDE